MMTSSMRELQKRYDWKEPKDEPEPKVINFKIDELPYMVEWSRAGIEVWMLGEKYPKRVDRKWDNLEEVMEWLEEKI